MNHFGYYGRITPHSGKKDDLVAILLEASALLQKNTDCFHYMIGVDDKDNIWVSELWKDKESHDSSLAPENIRALIMSARPSISDMGDTVETAVLGGKGTPDQQLQ